jgi:hypothetical protein
MIRFPPPPNVPPVNPEEAAAGAKRAPQSSMNQDIHALVKTLSHFAAQSPEAIPFHVIQGLSLKLQRVQRSVASGSYQLDPAVLRHDISLLQSTLKQCRHVDLQQSAQLFDPFLSQQAAVQSPQSQAPNSWQQTPPQVYRPAAADELSEQMASLALNSWQQTPPLMQRPAVAGTQALGQVQAQTRPAPKISNLARTQATSTTFKAPVITRKLKVVPELWSRMSVAQMNLPQELKVRKIECDHGATYWVSQTRAAGSFGKYRRGVDQDGRPVGLKELRMAGAEKAGINPRTNQPYTYPTSAADLSEEIELIRHLGGRIKLHDIITIGSKVYLVQSDMAGSLAAAIPTIPICYKFGVARLLMAQCAQQMAQMHASGFVHADFKSGNVLLDHDGSAVVIDFGKTTQLKPNGRAVKLQMGTYPSPLMATQVAVTAGVDVWALAVMFAMFHAPQSAHSFGFQASGEARMAQAQYFAAFYDQLKNPNTGRIDMERLHPDQGDMAFLFDFLRKIDVKGTQLVLEMLDPDDRTRVSMPDVAKHWHALATEYNGLAQQSTLALAHAAQAIGDTRITQALQSVREYDLQQQSSGPVNSAAVM